MPAMTVQEIRAALAENARAPYGPVRTARAEYLVDAAEATGDVPLGAQALLAVINAYEFGGESSKLLVPFARLLKLWDGDTAAFDQQSRHSLFWYFKWATSGMVSFPEVPLASIEGWLGEMESRYRQAGHSPRAVHMGRHRLARATGDTATAELEFEAWLDAPRDSMADCNACESSDQAWWHAFNGRDDQALQLWRPVLGGELVCAEEPHRALSHSLLPLMRLGRTDEARANHLRGYRMARGVPNLRSAIARHIEFCALTGNEARGLEILTEHAAFLTPGAEDADSRLDFLTGTLILLRRLIALGLGELELGGSTVADVAGSAQAQITDLCARFDARNGNTIVSERIAQRLAREPLVAALPLGWSSTLPRSAPAGDGDRRAQPSATPSPETATPETPSASAPSSGASSPASPVLDELVAEAKRLTELRHPQARPAWERVAASGAQLPPDVAALIERSRAGALMERDPAAAREVFTALAARFDELGDPSEARDARAAAAFAAFLVGDQATAEAEAVVIGAEAEAAYAAGELTARQYVSARSLPAYIAFNVFARQAESAGGAQNEAAQADDAVQDAAQAETPDPTADSLATTRLVAAELELAERLGDLGRAGVYHRMSAQLALFRQEFVVAAGHLEASRDAFLTAGQTWDAAEPGGLLGQLALQGGDVAVAEHHAREALAHGADLISPPDRARLASLLVETLSRQQERQFDLVDAALRAADLWEELSEPDTLHNRFIAARAYASVKRYAEAAALFDELMPRVHVPYDGPSIAMTREQYGDCLTQLNEHRKAAEQYVAAAALVQDDPRNQVAHARVAWSAAQALQNAGMLGEALPAYRRVAELWGTLGNIPARVRCLRSAAWIVGWGNTDEGHASRSEDSAVAAWTEALAQMQAVLAELKAVPEGQRSEYIEAEAANTREQIDQMLGNLRAAETEAATRRSAEGEDAAE